MYVHSLLVYVMVYNYGNYNLCAMMCQAPTRSASDGIHKAMFVGQL